MTRRGGVHRQHRAARRIEPRYQFMPGVMPADTPEWRANAMVEAHEDLAPIPGTAVHVLILDRVEGLDTIAKAFGDHARTTVEDLLELHGPESIPIMCCRVPHGVLPKVPS